MTDPRTFLVTGATGAQGGATVDALLAAGQRVRALVRDPRSGPAQMLHARGVEVHVGDFHDFAAVVSATAGVDGVFSMQLPSPPGDPDSERRAAATLVRAASDAGVEMFVHTAVARTGEHDLFAQYSMVGAAPHYWEGKAAAANEVRAGGLRRWAILKPAFFMDNFVPPRAKSLFPQLIDGVIVSAMREETRLDLIACEDIGRVAAAAFLDPGAFAGREIPLSGDSLTMTQVAATIASVTGSTVCTRHVSVDETIAAGTHRLVAASQHWAAVEGYQVDLGEASRVIPLQTFSTWAARRAAEFDVDRMRH